MNLSISDFKASNVYQSTNGEYIQGQDINKEYLKQHPIGQSYRIEECKRGLNLIIDRNNEHYSEEKDLIFRTIGRIVPSDEILDILKPDDLKIPMISREEIDLPDSDLLKSIHYFMSKKLTTTKFKRSRFNKFYSIQRESLDEKVLLTMGMLIEQWCDDLISKDMLKMFIEEEDEDDEIVEEEEEDLDNIDPTLNGEEAGNRSESDE
ncbi:unnamed protein product [Candida verbasci]|uniref:Uncharacterized protein n=1 Tax=Candida verbasci TaxID=1227364 RepID=A0A9W4TPL3_9ASCO|nr:unnamed protein product [Candida verbasci]